MCSMTAAQVACTVVEHAPVKLAGTEDWAVVSLRQRQGSRTTSTASEAPSGKKPAKNDAWRTMAQSSATRPSAGLEAK